MNESFKTLNIKTSSEQPLIKKGKVLGKGGMGIVEAVTINKNSPEYKPFLAEVAGWAEVRGDFRDVEIRFSGIRKEIADKKDILDKALANNAVSETVQDARQSLSESVMSLRISQKEYVEERIEHLKEMDVVELENWISTLGKPLPSNMNFALKSTLTENTAILDRLKEEFMILNLLQDENIITVYLNGNDSYLMEVLNGYKGGDTFVKKCESIRQLKKKVKYIIEGCKAVEKMHEFGIIHRDIKPENLMIKDGMVKFIDLGIARSDESTNVTMDGAVMGTANYMCLNQALGKQPSYNFDIYALAATLYSLVSGIEPYQVIFNKKTKKTLSTSENIANIELLMMAKDSDVLPLASNKINNIIPQSLNDMIEHGMEKHSTKYQSVYDFRRDLETFINNQPYTLKKEPEKSKLIPVIATFATLFIILISLLSFLLLNKTEKKETEFANNANALNIEAKKEEKIEVIAKPKEYDITPLIKIKSQADIKCKKIYNSDINKQLKSYADKIELEMTTANNFFILKKYDTLEEKYNKIIKDCDDLIALNDNINLLILTEKNVLEKKVLADEIDAAKFAKKHYDKSVLLYNNAKNYASKNDFKNAIELFTQSAEFYDKSIAYTNNIRNVELMRERYAEVIKKSGLSELEKYSPTELNNSKQKMLEFEQCVIEEKWEDLTTFYDDANKLLQDAIINIKKYKKAELRNKVLKNMTFYPVGQENHIMDFDGKGSYLELPVSKLKNLKEATIEGWVKWRSFGSWSRFFNFGRSPSYSFLVCNAGETNYLHARFLSDWKNLKNRFSKNKWYHIAISIAKNKAVLYLNGRSKWSKTTMKTFVDIIPFRATIGHSLNKKEDSLDGQIENFRVWSKALSGSEINIIKDQNIKTAPDLLVNLSFENNTTYRKQGRPRIIKDQFKWGGVKKVNSIINEEPITKNLPKTNIADFYKVKNAEFAKISGLAKGSKNAQLAQKKVMEDLQLPLEITTLKSGIVFRLIPNGSFIMGSPKNEKDRQTEETQHKVVLSKPFYAGKYEITQGQYENIMQVNPSRFTEVGVNGPVEKVNYNDAKIFLEKLCEYEGLAKGTFRLLSEAEWEFACRAGTSTATYFGNKIDRKQIVFRGKLSKKDVNNLSSTEPVGSYPANAYGLHDMLGNVYEWCDDAKKDFLYHETDPHGGAPVSKANSRGSSWYSPAKYVRSAMRDTTIKTAKYSSIGFRIAINPNVKITTKENIYNKIVYNEAEIISLQDEDSIEYSEYSEKDPNFDWDKHNKLRHKYSSTSMRKSMEQCDIILKHSIMDKYIMNVLTEWQLGKNNSLAKTNLAKYKIFPNLRYLQAAIYIQTALILKEEGELMESKQYLNYIINNSDTAIDEYKKIAKEML